MHTHPENDVGAVGGQQLEQLRHVHNLRLVRVVGDAAVGVPVDAGRDALRGFARREL